MWAIKMLSTGEILILTNFCDTQISKKVKKISVNLCRQKNNKSFRKMATVPAKGNPFGRLIPARYIVAILGCAGIATIYGLRVNLSVSILSMVNHTAISTTETDLQVFTVAEECLDEENVTEAALEDGPFIWSKTLQGTILSSYYWGYLVAQIPGGRMAELFSSKWVMFFSVSFNALCTVLTPVAAKIHYSFLLALRVGEGIGGGVAFPSMHVMLANWSPPAERSIMSSVCYAGSALGTVIGTLLAGLISAHVNWEASFYIQAGLSLVWLFLWAFLIKDSPETQPFISEQEREYIVTSLKKNSEKKVKLPMPWRSVLTSLPFIGILIAHTCSNWGWYMVLTELPHYMKSVLKYKISENALLTALPFLLMWIFSLALSKTLDVLRTKNIITTGMARKISTGFANIGPMICLIALCYIGCRRGLAVFLMTFAIVMCGGMFTGYLSNHIDIAPNFAGTLLAMTNMVATVPGIIVPIFIGRLTEDDPGINSWRIIFFVTAGFYLVEFVMYALLASGEEQPWNNPVGKSPIRTKPSDSTSFVSIDIKND